MDHDTVLMTRSTCILFCYDNFYSPLFGDLSVCLGIALELLGAKIVGFRRSGRQKRGITHGGEKANDGYRSLIPRSDKKAVFTSLPVVFSFVEDFHLIA